MKNRFYLLKTPYRITLKRYALNRAVATFSSGGYVFFGGGDTQKNFKEP